MTREWDQVSTIPAPPPTEAHARRINLERTLNRLMLEVEWIEAQLAEIDRENSDDE